MKQLPLILLILMMTLCIAHAEINEFDLTFTEREQTPSWKQNAAIIITGSGNTCTISGKGASFDGNTLTITGEGSYLLQGEFTNMRIIVSVDDKDKVQIILNNAAIHSDNGPALLIEEADKVFLTLPEGTESTLSDSTIGDDADTSLDAALFSRTDLCINGIGVLNVQGNHKHGVVSKDDLIIVGTVLNVTAASTALDGKDCVKLKDVSAILNAGSNGIRSDNAEDSSRGYVYILDSTLNVTAGSDGIQAETLLQADNAVLTITTGKGSIESQKQSEMSTRGGRSGFGGWGMATSTTAEGSWKGLKSAKDIQINGGAFVIDSQDDCIHANGNLAITDGIFTLSSSDDGIHADNQLSISGGEITISKSYEGIEASKLEISGGTIDITASDDGLNAAGGSDGSASADRWGRGMFSNGVGEIIISGGYIHINAAGDGIDSNNNILVAGGVTLVSGAANSGNAAFDYDGQATVTGGILIAAGSSGMAQSFTAAENQSCLFFGINGAKAGVNMAIVDEDGTIIAAYTPENSYSSVVVTAPGLQVGKTCTVVMDAVIDSADDHGFASDVNYTGGTAIGTIEITTQLQGGSGHSMGGGPGGNPGGPGGGGRRPGW